MKLKAFCITQTETPKMGKQFRFYQQVVTFFRGTRHTNVFCCMDLTPYPAPSPYLRAIFKRNNQIETIQTSCIVRTYAHKFSQKKG